MPNISFDIFFDEDFINLTATRSQGAPKVKPGWKVRTAPKLPPKEIAAPSKIDPRPIPKLQRPKIQAPPAPKAAPKEKATPETKPVPKPKAPEAKPETNGVSKPKAPPKAADKPEAKGLKAPAK